MMLERGTFERARSHWWWRPGWTHGTRYATFHLTFELAPELAEEAARIGPLLSAVPRVDVVPPEWLHLTMTGVGFMNELDAQTLDRVAHAVHARIPALDAGPLTVDRLVLHAEGLLMTVKSVPGSGSNHDEAFRPHVSLAYFSGDVDLDALSRAVAAASPRTLVIERPMVSLLELGRDEHVYTWRVLDQYPLS